MSVDSSLAWTGVRSSRNPGELCEAVENAVKEAAKMAKDIRRVYVKRLTCNVSDGRTVEYRAQVRIAVPV